MIADIALLNGNILTMNPQLPRAEAVAVKRDRIIKVGKNNEIKPFIGKLTRVLNLKGRVVVPGFIDTHIHVADFGRTLAWLDLKEADSIKVVQTLIREHSENIPKGKWIIGSGWNQENLSEKRFLTRQDIDAVAPDNPVVLYHQLGRTCTANSEALKLAGLAKNTIAPKDGTIERTETGEPTGVLHGTATNLVWCKVPEPSEEEMLKASREACKKIIESGITSIHWIVTTKKELLIAQKITLENEVPLRIFVIVSKSVFENLPTAKISGDVGAKVGGVLLFADGYLAAQTAALNEPYINNPINKGKLLLAQEELNKLATKIHKANLQIIIHAMGDKAVSVALNAFETISTVTSKKRIRHRLEQAAILDKNLIRRIKKQGITVSVQPKVAESEFTVWSATEHLGEKRARTLFPLKTLLSNGIRVIGGSDCPMEPLNPLLGIQAATRRKHFPNEQLTPEKALRMYTTNAAHATFDESEKGSVEENKFADLTVLSQDPTLINPENLQEIEVEMTVIGGRILHQKSAF